MLDLRRHVSNANVDTVGSRGRARARACRGGGVEGAVRIEVVRGHARGRLNHVAVPSCTALGMDLLKPCCQNKLPCSSPCLSRLRLSSLDLSPTCLCDDECVRPTCFRQVFWPAHVSSRRRVPSPDLPSGRVFARPVFRKCLGPPMCLGDDACLRPTYCFTTVSALARAVRSGSVFGRPRV